MSKKKLFVSIPMADRDEDDILNSMRDIANFVSSQFDEDFELIDQYHREDPPSDVITDRAWYLGKSIVDMADADLVAFDAGWRDGQGCIIEHMVCALYNIPYVDVTMNYDFDDDEVNDYTYDINEAGRLNEVLSETYEEASGESEDFEDALGFEHDDINDLTEDDSEDEEVVDTNDIHTSSDRRKKIADILKRSRKHAKNSVKLSTDISEESEDPEDPEDPDKLEPGEYDADA